MELDCTMFDNVTFDRVADNGIWIEHIDSRNSKHYLFLCNNGSFPIPNLWSLSTKCVIFPKGKTTWEGFHKPFVEGDIIYVDDFIAILSNITESGTVWYHCYYCSSPKIFRAQRDFGLGNIKDGEFRLATEKEKQKLFHAIKANGYRWNEETKTLEKLIEPIFKVGDRIRHKTHIRQGNAVTEIKDTHYILDNELALPFISQDDYELVPNKFDITTLKPFESRVLVRDKDHYEWEGAVFGRYDGNSFFTIGGIDWKYCIPYEGNEHLLGKTDDCNKFYKTWES